MARTRRTSRKEVRKTPQPGTKRNGFGVINQGYQLPLPLWQQLKSEATRRKILGLENQSLQAIAVAAFEDWLMRNRGRDH